MHNNRFNHYHSLFAALLTEIVMTMMFLFVIMGATDERAPQGLAPIAIGFCLTLMALCEIQWVVEF